MTGDDTNFKIEYQYDSEVDALFIYKDSRYKYDTTIELDNDVLLDFDDHDVPAALEILNASKILNVPKYSLHNLQMIQMSIDVNEKSISLKAYFGVLIHNKKQVQSMDTFTSNDVGIPNIVTELATV